MRRVISLIKIDHLAENDNCDELGTLRIRLYEMDWIEVYKPQPNEARERAAAPKRARERLVARRQDNINQFPKAAPNANITHMIRFVFLPSNLKNYS